MTEMSLDQMRYITDEVSLRALHPAPMSRATEKVLPKLDKHCRRIIELSPFFVLATQGPAGADVSPKGDPPGSVKILDNQTLLLPERVGNNRFDGLVNILANPNIGLLFLVPGMNETLRINGTAKITDDPALLDLCKVRGRPPRVAAVVTVEEAFLHCGKAVVRSGLWDLQSHIDRAELPSYSKMLLDQISDLTDAENERQAEIMAARGLY